MTDFTVGLIEVAVPAPIARSGYSRSVKTEAQQLRADQVRADRQVWRDLVTEVGRDRMLEPGPDHLHDEHLPDVRAGLEGR